MNALAHLDRNSSGNQDLGKLLKYYLSCIEEEDLRSRQVNSDAINRQYLSPKADQGGLFRGEDTISWEISGAGLKFLRRYSAEKEQPKYLYGYPVYRNRQGFLLPLFMSEADVDLDEKNTAATISPVHAGTIQVNLHLFQSTHPSLVERLDLQDMLEADDFGSFDDRLRAALEERQESKTSIEELTTPRGSPGWKNGSILFRDLGGHFTAHLRRELSAMQDTAEKVQGTALGMLFDQRIATGLAPERVELLEIVPLNRSQHKAATSALKQPFTVITGPPGTGKSQVVVTLIASLAAAGKPVLFVSKNNEAVEVVRRKFAEILKKDDWTLRLGSKRHIDLEMERLIDKAVTYSPEPNENLDGEWQRLEKHIDERQNILADGSEASRLVQEYTTALDRQRRNISRLHETWQTWAEENDIRAWPVPDRRAEARRLLEDAQVISGGRWPGLWLFLLKLFYGHRLIRKYQVHFLELIGKPPCKILGWQHEDELNWHNLLLDLDVITILYAVQKEAADIESITESIHKRQPSDKIKRRFEIAEERIQTASIKICRLEINRRVAGKSALLPTVLKEYWDLTRRAASYYRKTATAVQRDFSRAARKMLAVTPAVVVTNLSAHRSLPLEPNVFECVIVDEASQCDIASALPLLFRAKRMVVIGDPKQLRHISAISERNEQRIAHAEGTAHLLSRYSYRTKSLYDCSAEMAARRGQAPIFLAEHYRSQPEIIEFSNRMYYGRRLIVRTSLDNKEIQPLLWHDVPSQIENAKGSLLNKKEAEQILVLTKHLIENSLADDQSILGIVTPYKRQRNYIEDLLRSAGILNLLKGRLIIGTVHTFQGGETDVMILSPVLTNGVSDRAAEWISNEEGLLNVALTRARKALHIVGDKSYCMQTPGPIGELAQFVEHMSESALNKRSDSPPIQRVCDLLNSSKVWYQREWPEGNNTRRYYLDFMVVGMSGTRYNIEVDGRQHYFSAEAIAEDDARDAFMEKQGYQVIRARAKDIMASSSSISRVIERLV